MKLITNTTTGAHDTGRYRNNQDLKQFYRGHGPDGVEYPEKGIMLCIYDWRKEMRTETALKVEAIDLLLKAFGALETERFITSIKSNNFDYTEWHKELLKSLMAT